MPDETILSFCDPPEYDAARSEIGETITTPDGHVYIYVSFRRPLEAKRIRFLMKRVSAQWRVDSREAVRDDGSTEPLDF